jgi:hypothetical protein
MGRAWELEHARIPSQNKRVNSQKNAIYLCLSRRGEILSRQSGNITLILMMAEEVHDELVHEVRLVLLIRPVRNG